MAQVNLYKKDGKEAGVIELPDALFSVAVKPSLIHEVIVAQDANSRKILGVTKDRSEVRGGGRKPWKQKGTGRARHGSRRSPIWVGGGVTFGPNALRNFAKKVNKKVRRKAIAMLLSDKVKSGEFIVVEDFAFDVPKTSVIARMRQALPGSDATALLITTKEDEAIIRGTQNLPKTQTIAAHSLNARDLAKYRYVIASKSALDIVKETYLA